MRAAPGDVPLEVTHHRSLTLLCLAQSFSAPIRTCSEVEKQLLFGTGPNGRAEDHYAFPGLWTYTVGATQSRGISACIPGVTRSAGDDTLTPTLGDTQPHVNPATGLLETSISKKYKG